MEPRQRVPQNQATPLVDYNVVENDSALCDAVRTFAGSESDSIINQTVTVGELAGSSQAREHWHKANENPPVAKLADRFGRRVDEVDFHPSWHWLMENGIGFGLGASAWTSTDSQPHLRRAASYIAWGQVEQGHMCPITMTYAAIPALRANPDASAIWEDKLASSTYDFGLRPLNSKSGALAGMGMTEKQGGSDVRTNATLAEPTDITGEFVLTGHKWFTSAPMNDAFLTLAQTPSGLTCFLVPRVLPDESRNPIHIIRLKDKLGNRSNASAELEFDNALGIRLGDEGHGIRTIIDMVSATRMDCILGSSSIMRKAVAEATWHASQRHVFGSKLNDQPAMQNVLADLAVESEAATRVGLRLASTLDSQTDEHEQALRRIGLALEKFWVCKRTPMMVAEAMECLGGNGYIEESGMPLLYREAPVNSIWEGSGNVNALDMLRALQREPATLDAWLTEVGQFRGADERLDRVVDSILVDLADLEAAEARARHIAARMAVALQGAQLLRSGDPDVADAFCASRLGGEWDGVFGTLPGGVKLGSIVERATAGSQS